MKSDYTEHLSQGHGGGSDEGRVWEMKKKIKKKNHTISLMSMPQTQWCWNRYGTLLCLLSRAAPHRTAHFEKGFVSGLSQSLDILFTDLQEESKTGPGFSSLPSQTPMVVGKAASLVSPHQRSPCVPTECRGGTFIMVHNPRQSLVDCWKSMH